MYFELKLAIKYTSSANAAVAVISAYFRLHAIRSIKGWIISFLFSMLFWAFMGFGYFWPVWVLISAIIILILDILRYRSFSSRGVSLPNHLIELELKRLKSLH